MVWVVPAGLCLAPSVCECPIILRRLSSKPLKICTQHVQSEVRHRTYAAELLSFDLVNLSRDEGDAA